MLNSPILTLGQPAGQDFIQRLAQLQIPSRKKRWPSGKCVSHVDAVRASITDLLVRDRSSRGNDAAAQYGLLQAFTYLESGIAFGGPVSSDGEFLYVLRKNVGAMSKRRS